MWKFHVHLFSHIGNSRSKQEDNFLLCDGEHLSPSTRDLMLPTDDVYYIEKSITQDDALFAISDGMGGYEYGELASLLTLTFLWRQYDQLKRASDKNQALQSVVGQLNQDFLAYIQKHPACRKMGATLSGYYFFNNQILGFHVGDSRLYLYENEKLTQLTRDHTEGQRLLELGLLTADEVEHLARRKHLYCYVSQEAMLVPDILSISPNTEDAVFVLCTDGLTDVLSDEEILFLLRNDANSMKEQGYSLLNLAKSRRSGYGDNITLMLIQRERRG